MKLLMCQSTEFLRAHAYPEQERDDGLVSMDSYNIGNSDHCLFLFITQRASRRNNLRGNVPFCLFLTPPGLIPENVLMQQTTEGVARCSWLEIFELPEYLPVLFQDLLALFRKYGWRSSFHRSRSLSV